MLTNDFRTLWDALMEQTERIHELETEMADLQAQLESLRH